MWSPPQSSPPDTTSRMVGLTWAEEMDAHNLPDEVNSLSVMIPTPHTPWKVTEVSGHTEQYLVCSLTCMEKEGWCWLADCFALPKVAVMKTLEVDKIMAAQQWPSLTPTLLSPLTELLETINKEEDCWPGGVCSGGCNYPSGKYIFNVVPPESTQEYNKELP